jgi:DNA helicase-2/ATP-dependent DNA helicase PcrA
MQLNEEQTLAVQHPIGEPACLIAGAGSGKTRVLTERVRWLIGQGIPPRRICAVTFTNKAAGEMISRLGISASTPREQVPRISTIHSLALSAIRRNPQGFGLQARVSPLDESDAASMVKKIIDRKESEENQWAMMEMISYHRARGLCFASDYTEEIHQLALKMHGGYHAMDEERIDIWRAYEEEKKANSVVDFDDMLHLVVHRGKTDPVWRDKLERTFEFILMDEAQDTNPVQWELINMLLHPDNMNMYVVGDMSQCQPPGSMVKVKVADQKPHGLGKAWSPSQWAEKDIADLTGDELVESWTQKDQRTYKVGRKIKVASRLYAGSLVILKAGGRITKVTPNHWCWVRFNKQTQGKHLVYLMWRPDYGFRIGRCQFKLKQGGFALTSRLNIEKAERAWILKICETRVESEAWEEIYSIRYGVPESVFTAEGCLNKTQDLIELVFREVGTTEGGHRCLIDHGLIFEQPIIQRGQGTFHGYNVNYRGYFKTAAANILPDCMDIPIEGDNKSLPITGVEQKYYTGPVYSLDVEKDHTYVVDNLVIGNSIYGFNGAVPELLKQYSENWRGVVPHLYRIARNHRSVPEIVHLANAVQACMTNTIPLNMESWRGLQGEHGTTKLMKACEPRDVAEQIATEIWHDNQLKKNQIPYRDNCILVRSGKTQVRDLEAALVKRRIPYVVRGGQSLLQTEEVRDLMSYMRLVANPNDYMALVRATSIPKRGIGPKSLEAVRDRAKAQYNNNLITACQDDKKLMMFAATVLRIEQHKADPLKALEEVKRLIDYQAYIRQKYAREPERIVTKLENIDRLTMMITTLLEDNQMTIEDLVFQLSMDKQSTDPYEDGKVVISTIHSAKGLEWRRVWVTNCYEGSLPHKFCLGSPSEIEEERRLFYVACTRAKDTLVLCVPAMQQMGPNTTSLTPSRFLYEIKIV